MARSSGGYSTFVRILKIGLPLLSLGILSTLFLFSSRIEVGQNQVIEGIDVDRLVNEQGIGRPQIAGRTSDGALFLIEAQRAIPDLNPSGGLDATTITASVTEPDGGLLGLTANQARFERASNAATLNGEVTIQSSAGLTIETERLDIQSNFEDIAAPGAINAQSPFGQLTAGAMQISRSNENSGPSGYRFVFTNGVRLIYTPPTNRSDP